MRPPPPPSPPHHGLPTGDAHIDALPPALRTAIAQHWTRRVTSELQVSLAFSHLAPWLRSLHADATVVTMMERAAAEEVAHADLCLHLAEVYAGTSVTPPSVPFEMPRFGFDDERLEAAVHVAGLCCVNETLATAYLESCLSLASTPIAIAANRAHLREEIDHARLGWAHLSSSALTPELRLELGACVPRLLAANVPLWEQEDAFLPREGVPAHGLPSHEQSYRTARAAALELVIPGFRHVGIPVGDDPLAPGRTQPDSPNGTRRGTMRNPAPAGTVAALMSVERMFKYEGLGNDFIVVERPAAQRDDAADAALARALCDRHFGVGADGLLFVDPETPSMHVVNADGSVPEMCGNGLRCVALHYARRAPATADPLLLRIGTGAGPHDCQVERTPGHDAEAWVTVEMAVPSLDPRHVPAAQAEPLIDAPIRVGEHTVHLTGVSMGNPHAVTFDALPEPVRIRQVTLGPAVQALPLFPRGVNVGFASALDSDAAGLARSFRLDVYERGAGWTLACGTGACAAGVAAVVTGRAPRHTPLRFELPGGPLEITVGEPGERVRMRGPARFVFEGLPSPRLLGASA